MLVLSDDIQTKLEAALVARGVLNDERLAYYKSTARGSGQSLVDLLVEDGVIGEEQLTEIIAKISGVPYVDLSAAHVSDQTLSLLPHDIAERFMAVPIGELGSTDTKRLVIAMLDVNNIQAIDFLSNITNQPLKICMASKSGIQNILDQYDIDVERGVDEAMGVGQASDVVVGDKDRDVKVIIHDSPISKILNELLEYAGRSRASDIHIEPLEDAIKVRCRIDGVLREVMRLPKSLESALVSRVKILSNLKIDEHRKPQDGQFTVMVNGHEIDLRIAISPVVWGEQVVIRLLDKSGSSFKLEEMGYTGRALRDIRKGIHRPSGMVLTSGPTGSGKTTSLYALIQEIYSDEINIVTLEDPVEYKIPGVNQIQVNPAVGLTFASGLRSILRQDPDVVMVGEIRDNETANLAVQAALTGHLVFSTLHTNSAAGVLPRLLDMDIEPFLIASTVNTVIGQRLVRRIATNKSTYESTDIETQSIHTTLEGLLPKTAEDVTRVSVDLGYKDLPLASQAAYTLTRGKDTPTTPDGYKGRLGLYEVMDVTEQIQELIVHHATSAEIQRKAVEQGTIPMRQDGYLKALNGLTTLDEVNRVTTDIL